MSQSPLTLRRGIQAINEMKAGLVYPLAGQKDPASLWRRFFPRKEMRWEWTENADDSVADLWILREALSRSRQVVYLKWYKGRATFFSKDSFVLLSAFLGPARDRAFKFKESKRLYDALQEHSPLSSKRLKKATELQGKFFETVYQKALRELWERALIVGWGEVDDGAFPSLNIGCARDLFEEEWKKAEGLNSVNAGEQLRELWGSESLFFREAQKIKAKYSL